MSRGPGVMQRLILESLAIVATTQGVQVTEPDHTPAESASLRRAAHRLAALGLVRLEWRVIDGRRRLTAWLPADLPCR